MPKYTHEERAQIKSIVATLSLKRIPEDEIIQVVFHQTNKTISRMTLHNIRQQIKRESYDWYKVMRQKPYIISILPVFIIGVLVAATGSSILAVILLSDS